MIKSETAWNEEYKYHPFAMETSKKPDIISRRGIALIPDGDMMEDMPRYMNRIANQMLSTVVRKLRNILDQYVSVTNGHNRSHT